MNTTVPNTWYEINQRYLSAALAVVRAALERHTARAQDAPEPEGQDDPAQALGEAADAMTAPPALETLSATFGLTPFERDLLLLCAGMELESNFAGLCAAAQDDPRRGYPTFGLALAALPEAHWSALTPAAPLRRWRLLEVGSGDTLTTSLLRIDERVLHHLAGVPYLDERLVGLLEPVPAAAEDLVPSHRALANQLAAVWEQAGTSPIPIVQLCGEEGAGKRAIAAAACAALGLNLVRCRLTRSPDLGELEALLRLVGTRGGPEHKRAVAGP